MTTQPNAAASSKTILLFTLAIFLCGSSAAALRADDQQDPLKDKGPLQDVSEPIGKMIKLSWKSGKIEPAMESDREAVQSLINELRNASGGGGSGSTYGGNNWSFTFNGQKLSGEFSYEGARLFGTSTYRAKLREGETPNRELSIESTTRDSLSISFHGGDSPYLFRLNQQPDGRLIVQEISGDQVFSQRSESFATFCREHVDFVRDRLIPLLKHVGIEAPTTPYDEHVRDEVLRLLKPLDEKDAAKFRQLAAGLDSDDFTVRQQTEDELSSRFEELAPLIRHASLDDSYSAEARSRFFQIVRQKSGADDLRAHDVITKAKLLGDAPYLVWLLSETADDKDRPFVVARLENVTGEKYGADKSKWQIWLDTQIAARPLETEKAIPVELLKEVGKLQKASAHTSRFAKLQWDGRNLRLDHQHWAKQFGGKTVKQLSDEIAEEVKKRGLPATWWNRINDESIGYPQVLFQQMEEELSQSGNVHRHYHYGHGYHPANRSFAADGIDASLEVVSQSQRGGVFGEAVGDGNQRYLKLRLRETEDPQRTLVVFEDKDRRLQLSLVSEQSNSVVRLMELTEGSWVVQDVRDTEVFAAKADTFRELYDENSEYFENEFFPLMKHAGISTPDAE